MSNNDVKTLRITRTQRQDHLGTCGHKETSIRQAEVFKQCSKLPVATTSYFSLQVRSLSSFHSDKFLGQPSSEGASPQEREADWTIWAVSSSSAIGQYQPLH